MLAILLPTTSRKGTQTRFDRLARKIYDHEFVMANSTHRLTPVIGFTQTVGDATIDEYEDRAWDASMYQSAQLDLHPTRWVSAMSARTDTKSWLRNWLEPAQTSIQVVAQQVIAIVLPFFVYLGLGRLGVDVTGVVYLALVFALAFTAVSIYLESLASQRSDEPPSAPEGPPPLASAIIAAYLPNEAGTVVETVEAFLSQDYPNFEVILAYNTPSRLDVEDELNAIASRDPRFRPLRVEGSVSKAQNVNAAVAHVRGEFVGLFDADHHPAPGSFHRAWRWLAGGAGVVQGHCVIRNGGTNFVTRLVATEFESIYAVSHPGRARLHGFGVFGGSNGYWRTSLLHRTRMRGSMLTEDIDSSMRVVQSGEVIISDPHLVSTELAPETFGALWNQRLRWAQGWSQVSLRHLIRMIRKAPSLRQRIGVFYLLGWREAYPWISLQMFPLLAYWWFRGEPAIDWFVPIFVITTLLTLSVGPAQTWFSYRLAHPTIKQHRRWFLLQGLSSLLFYTELKNVMARTAHLKEAMRERKWKVTPRTGSVVVDALEVAATESSSTKPTAGKQAEGAAPAPPGSAPSTNDATALAEVVHESTSTGITAANPEPEPASADTVIAGEQTSPRGRKAPKRNRRHRQRPVFADARGGRWRPTIYDVEMELDLGPKTIYDHELENEDWVRESESAAMTRHSRDRSNDRRTAIPNGEERPTASHAQTTLATAGIRARLYEPDFQHLTINPTWRPEPNAPEPSEPAPSDFEGIQRMSDDVLDRASDHLERDRAGDDSYSTLLATEEPVSR